MAGSAKVGVVIPVYNRVRHIAEAVPDVWAQIAPPHKLVIVDDGSTDETPAAIEALLHDPRRTCETIVVRRENGGGGVALNTGAAALPDCEFLAAHDSDDLWPADYLQRMVSALIVNPDRVAASCDRVTEDLDTGEKRLNDSKYADGVVTETFLRERAPIPSLTVVRAEHFRAIGGYDPSLRRRYDIDFHLRLSLRGPWLYVPGAPVRVRRNTTAQFGGEAHLTDGMRSIEQRVIHTNVLDRFVMEKGGAAAIKGGAWRRLLARKWRAIGADLRSAGQRDEAAFCFRRAAEICPMDLKAHFWAKVTPPTASPRRPGMGG